MKRRLRTSPQRAKGCLRWRVAGCSVGLLRDGDLDGPDHHLAQRVADLELPDDSPGLDLIAGLLHEGFMAGGVEFLAGLNLHAHGAVASERAEQFIADH